MEIAQLLADVVYFTGFIVHATFLLLGVPVIHATFGPPVNGWSLAQHLMIRWIRAGNTSLKIHQQRLMVRLGGWLRSRGLLVAHDTELPAFWLGDTPRTIRSRLARGEVDLLIVYIHGGGFCCGSPLLQTQSVNTWRTQLEQQGIRVAVALLEYELAPEVLYPQPIHRICQTIRELRAIPGVNRAKMVLAGDSAGGNLAISTVQHLQPTEQPNALVLISPWVRLYPSSDAICRNISTDIITPRNLLTWANTYMGVACYTAPNTIEVVRPAIAPPASLGATLPNEATALLASSAGMEPTGVSDIDTCSAVAAVSTAMASQQALVPTCIPPSLIVVGSRELFVEDVVAYACMLEEAGTHVSILVEPGAVHNYAVEPTLAGSDAYQRAVGNITDYMRKVVHNKCG
ncbi:Alpha/Beta hydrolase protein [Syncephalis pseudoplumigaleata]|uniref:Alpha/Beta hydrolase protein n=1 Tax=Syncephalis pseudoplumigaleata TaxID=1712513 RepID=A0A4P9Z213_9FUNG|nr:Alpha/Beta hydrolase protein [Syncephalis pseudoplumigaleata]|eukprot:RKP25480.1 Alpha/Beta hydrolase protein [Syncephalis pseudoplumigaleata]